MTRSPFLDNARARALFLDRHGLAETPSGTGRGEDLRGVLQDLGFVQLDSINTVARAHHMILHARRPSYRPAALHRLHDTDRALFEHWTHDASMIDMAHFPHWRLKFARHQATAERRWQHKGRPDWLTKMDEVLRRIADDGPCGSGDVGATEARSSGGWWDWHPSKAAMEHLWRTGALSVTRRDGFRKIYDVTENVIPQATRAASVDTETTVDWACGSALDRLGFATSGELAAFWALITPDEAKRWVADGLAGGTLTEAEIGLADGARRRVVLRPETLDRPTPRVTPRLRILSPFDPALRDRARAERLFGFHYRIEVFVPEAQRRYGYYVFPILEGDRLIGRIDMKAERGADVLAVRALWPEAGVRWGAGRQARLEAALARSARLAAVGTVNFAADWLRATQPPGT
ncbi:winged helix-turn-helix domain-containing protein [Jannaschia sp. M317]|uniref:winged helix-turn-helix domain-containing protein n=1 Tax=Jannaschia sp. M317 TaxID=2867011 RepID=UPI0021A47A2F|nr:crosslink repair DNA glycosylase YcaQ family protein [Jannaschia sp. M317]UWQ18404.1 winged helix DNA-binding domain-containing protein [Jannaschia sp. M317]